MLKTSTPEEELLLWCARAHLEGPAADRVHALLEQDLDWNRVVALAEQHYLVTRLYGNLHEIAPGRVPRAVSNELRLIFDNNLQRNLLLIGQLRRLVRLFEDLDILLIPLKGPVFAQQIYRDVRLRSSGDLDILIRKEDFARVRDLLDSAGYEPRIRCRNDIQEKLHLESSIEFPFVSVDHDDVLIDLHWDVTHTAYLRAPIAPELMKNASVTSLFGENVRTLSTEDLLFVACIHAANHFWQYLDVISDVAEIVRGCHSLNWDRLNELVQKTRCHRALFVSLLLANDLFDAPVPKEVLAIANHNPRARKLADRVEGKLFEEPIRRPKFRRAYDELETKEILRDRMRILLFFAFVPTAKDYGILPLPEVMTALYYVIRPLRLTFEFLLLRRAR